ncbi:MAG: hypothetical protein LUQ24_00350 [Methanobacterium sp.]|nr:hypothetical protein [Methanobacterium sp.]
MYNENFNPILAGVGFGVIFIGMGFNIQVRIELGKNWVPSLKQLKDRNRNQWNLF